MLLLHVFIWTLAVLFQETIAAPSVAFPINAQVPPVAVVNQEFSFVFSGTTFSSSGSLTYTIQNAPSWLQIDSAGLRLYGTPGSGDAGAPVFNLVATGSDGSGSSQVTLVVLQSQSITLGTPIDQQLAKFGTVQEPNELLAYPGHALTISLSPQTFVGTNAGTSYYATSTNNSPLPSWLSFDSQSLSISGMTPPMTSPYELPQTFEVTIAASNVVGFSEVSVSFSIVLENHILVFTESLVIVNATKGQALNYDGLLPLLTLDGQPANAANISMVSSNAPSWLTISDTTLDLTGTVPEDADSLNLNLTIGSPFGDLASTNILINVGNGTLMLPSIGTLNATAGKFFSYTLNMAELPTGATVSLLANSAVPWLQYNAANSTLYGLVPSSASLGQQTIGLQVSLGSISQTADIGLDIQSAAAALSSSSAVSTPAPTSSASSTSSPVPTSQTGNNGLNTTQLALIITFSIIGGLLLLALLLFIIFRCKRNDEKNEKTGAQNPKNGAHGSFVFMQSPALNRMRSGFSRRVHRRNTLSRSMRGSPKASMSISSTIADEKRAGAGRNYSRRQQSIDQNKSPWRPAAHPLPAIPAPAVTSWRNDGVLGVMNEDIAPPIPEKHSARGSPAMSSIQNEHFGMNSREDLLPQPQKSQRWSTFFEDWALRLGVEPSQLAIVRQKQEARSARHSRQNSPQKNWPKMSEDARARRARHQTQRNTLRIVDDGNPGIDSSGQAMSIRSSEAPSERRSDTTSDFESFLKERRSRKRQSSTFFSSTIGKRPRSEAVSSQASDDIEIFEDPGAFGLSPNPSERAQKFVSNRRKGEMMRRGLSVIRQPTYRVSVKLSPRKLRRRQGKENLAPIQVQPYGGAGNGLDQIWEVDSLGEGHFRQGSREVPSILGTPRSTATGKRKISISQPPEEEDLMRRDSDVLGPTLKHTGVRTPVIESGQWTPSRATFHRGSDESQYWDVNDPAPQAHSEDHHSIREDTPDDPVFL